MQEFEIGDKVSFVDKNGFTVNGVITHFPRESWLAFVETDHGEVVIPLINLENETI